MARQPRFFIPGMSIHAIQRGNNRIPIFDAPEDYRFFLRCVQEAIEEQELRVHAYVLMPNHIHLVVTPGTSSSLPATLQSVGRRYVYYFNHRYRRTGTLWEGRYRAAAIDTAQYLFTCMRYVELNPVRAGLAEDPKAFPWSSHGANAFGAVDPLLTPHDLYAHLAPTSDERCRIYRAMFGRPVPDAQLHAIRETTHKNWALGDAAFCQRVADLAGRRASPSRSGDVRHLLQPS